MAEGSAANAAYAKVVARAWSDPEFKARLLVNPAAVLAEAGIKPPPGKNLRIVEDTDSETHLILPSRPAGGELSDAALEQVAGGYFPWASQQFP
jgi:hypothetical protein